MAFTETKPRAGTPELVLAGYEASDRKLRRSMSLTQLLALSLGGIIGSGWLFAALAADGKAGPASVVSWVVGGVLVLFVALNYAEVSAMLPRTGALSRYPQLTHGGFAGFLLGWAYLLSAVSVPAIEAEASVTYLAGKFPSLGLFDSTNSTLLSWPNGILLAFGFMLGFFVLNFVGIRILAEFNRLVVLWKIVIPTLTFVFLFAAFKGSNFSVGGGFAPLGKAPIFEAIATTGIVFSYLGFRQALEYAGEARNPQRDVPRATIYSVLIAIVLYTLLQLGFTGAINWHSAGLKIGAWAGLSSSPWAAAPFYRELHAAGIGVLAGFASLLIWDAVISPAGTGYVYLGTSTRTFYGLSVQRFFPPGLQAMNRTRIPWPALVASLVVGVFFFVPAPSWYSLVGFISSATVLTYIMGGAGLAVLRRTAPGLSRPYRMPGLWVLAPLGFLSASMIVYWSGFETLADVFAAVFLALFVLLWYYGPAHGWFSQGTGLALGILFLVAWLYVNDKGGYVMRTVYPAKGSWTFGTYYVAFAAVLVLTIVATWLASSPAGRHQINRSWWFVFLCLALFLVSYYGEYGPLAKPRIAFPWSDLIAVGIGLVTFLWAVAAGYETDEIRELVAVAESGGAAPAASAPSADATGTATA
jgi:amino acid transporter